MGYTVTKYPPPVQYSTGTMSHPTLIAPIARSSDLPSIPLASGPISQEILRKCEKAAKNSSYVCHQAVGFNRCLTRVQDFMQTQLKIIQGI